jgi:metal-responsive CopG/Arc/MetJ family transcriptional regulator
MAGFKIPSVPPTTNKTIRFPNDLVTEVEELIKNKDCTFSAFVIAAVRAAAEEVRPADDKQ